MSAEPQMGSAEPLVGCGAPDLRAQPHHAAWLSPSEAWQKRMKRARQCLARCQDRGCLRCRASTRIEDFEAMYAALVQDLGVVPGALMDMLVGAPAAAASRVVPAMCSTHAERFAHDAGGRGGSRRVVLVAMSWTLPCQCHVIAIKTSNRSDEHPVVLCRPFAIVKRGGRDSERAPTSEAKAWQGTHKAMSRCESSLSEYLFSGLSGLYAAFAHWGNNKTLFS